MVKDSGAIAFWNQSFVQECCLDGLVDVGSFPLSCFCCSCTKNKVIAVIPYGKRERENCLDDAWASNVGQVAG